MSLYNMIMGNNPLIGSIVKMLGFCPNDGWGQVPKRPEQGTPDHQQWVEEMKGYNFYPVGRFRDVWLSADGREIGVLSRNYGENEWVNELWRTHPLYKSDQPEKDYTYHRFIFRLSDDLPDEVLRYMKELAEITDNTPCFERYTQLIQDLDKGIDNEATQHAKKVGKKIADGLMGAIEEGKSRKITDDDGNSVYIGGGK